MKKTVYLFIGLIGIFLILLAVFPILFIFEKTMIETYLMSNEFNNIMLSFGTGFVTSALISFLIDSSNKKISKEHSDNMKRNILLDLIEEIYEYNNKDFEFVKIELVIKTDLLVRLTELCKVYIPMGIQFYNVEELKSLNALYGTSRSFYDILQSNDIVGLYNEYEDVFSSAINLKFDHGPYSEDENIVQLCNYNDKNISSKGLCKIGETIFLYKQMNHVFNNFYNEFKYLLDIQ